MASSFKKENSLETKMGRPLQGSLSTYPVWVRKAIKTIRRQHIGWGAASILQELESSYNLSKADQPSIAGINRFLKEQGFIPTRLRSNQLPEESSCKKTKLKIHTQWEMDAKGPISNTGIGPCAPINIKDRKSKLHCISFPVPVKNSRSQPKTDSYYWALRLAFEKRGLPKSIRVDHDSVFYENNSSSPYPKNLHLWLIGLGVKLCFIRHKPPIENAGIERSHQTIYKQVYQGCKYQTWKELRIYSDLRVEKLNTKLPNRMLAGKSSLEKYPRAKHSGRFYTVKDEERNIDMKKVYRYLAKATWYRKVSQSKTISLGGKIYYLKKAQTNKQVKITFCNRRKKLMFHDVNEQLLAVKPIKNFSKITLMGSNNKQLNTMKYKLLNRKEYPLKS